MKTTKGKGDLNHIIFTIIYHHLPSYHHQSIKGKWKGPTQYESDDQTLMMLPADLALTRDRV